MSDEKTPMPPQPQPKKHARKPDPAHEWLDPAKPVLERVDLWMKESGFPLEYKSAAILQKQSFAVGQGLHVPNEEDEADALEIDLIGTYVYGKAEFDLLVECKTVVSPRAWVVLMHGEELQGQPEHGLGRSAIVENSGDQFSEEARSLFPQWTGTRGMAIRTMKEKGNKPAESEGDSHHDRTAYAAVHGLVSRAVSWLRMKDEELPEQPVMVVPTLVIDGDLIRADWNKNAATFNLSITDRVWVGWGGHRNWKLPYFSVAVVTLAGLDVFAAEMMTWAQTWCVEATEAADLHVAILKQRAQVGKWNDHLNPNRAYARRTP